MWDTADCLTMSEEQQYQLEAWVRAPSTPQKIVLRARICLLSRTGLSNRRFAEAGVVGLEHEPPRGPSVQRLGQEQVKAIVEATLQTTPPDATHWSTRTLARQ